MPKTYPPRPTDDFRLTCFAWQLENEANHRRAGFPEIPRDVLVRRFWQHLRFLQNNGLTTRIIAKGPEEISSDTALSNSDLTDEGYLFEQRYGDRWVGRMYKDGGEAKEEKFLSKWFAELTTSPRSAQQSAARDRVKKRGA